MVKDKTWNHFIVVVGIPQSGKSAYGLRRAVELGRTPAYVLAHDSSYNLPEEIFDDAGKARPVTIHRHETIEAGARALASRPGGVHAFVVDDTAPVLELARAISKRSLERSGRAKTLTPTVVLIDEGVMSKDASPHRIGLELKKSIALRRHHNVGVIITVQDPRYIHYSLYSLSTEIVLFNTQDEEAIKYLVRMGVRKEMAYQAPRLPQYKYLVHKGGFAMATNRPDESDDSQGQLPLDTPTE